MNDFYSTVTLQRHDHGQGVVVKLHSILERLYDLLISPLWDEHINPQATIIFVPDKVRNRIFLSSCFNKVNHIFT